MNKKKQREEKKIRRKQIVKKVVRGRQATIYIVHFFFVSPVLDVGPDGKVTYEKKESSK